MPCRVQYGVNNSCGDLLFPGGADNVFYVGYKSDLGTAISTTQSSVIQTLSFTAYTGLVRFESQKLANKFDWEWVKGAGGNGFFLHRATLKLIALSVQDDVEVQRLLQAQDAFIINKNNNGSYLIYGATNGLTSVPGAVGTTGQAFEDDVSDTVTLQGPEKTKPLRFLVAGDTVDNGALTKAYLDARVI